MKSLAAIALGFFAQIVTYFVVWGIAVVWEPPNDALEDVFIFTIAIIGAVATIAAISWSTGRGRIVAGAVSATFFAIVVLYVMAILEGIENTT
jgi:hypothetical protein